MLHQHPGDARPFLFYRRSHICLGLFRFRLQLSRHLVGASRSLRQHLLILLLSLVSVRLDLRFRLVFGLFNPRRFFYVKKKKKKKKKKSACEYFSSSSIPSFCEREKKNRNEKRARARHEREKINRREREKKQTNTNLASPRSRSRSPLAPPAKASECRLVFANPFVLFFFSLLFFYSGSLSSLFLSLSLSIQNYHSPKRRERVFISARAVCSCRLLSYFTATKRSLSSES